ncbi:MAG TPA: Gfo/Idh/MocA family oxidoreductase [Candidatus Hydrogenedentes bacterium]|jgi:predicted dehydrogenase|nr:MAG: Oxidoreductase family, NAD-binding Rossmann fold [Candidatus Hydrogenedentes bacterium ADurb.Bin170]HOD96196.1 Gfo/Idh/MocA family oxidoreductase [Candidatus Hydrogenedentota bacterium]HOM47771.1 Gfo/Idh/MocA family oxidoreductase [Candidatus Hydrogenedentota bacterium]HOR51648.1 Gfo/Idh/MocA family oxidoreductase [Candidatus Hydrogenedentota bacterium]HPK25477.1 Gfo/Idh/MocA family oxidoreductase [Candidatus Hydrogenedentota bacterium]
MARSDTHLRITISGTGFAGDFTARAFSMIPHKNGVALEFAGVTSGHLGNARLFAQRHGVTAAFESHQEMLDAVQPHIDCIACANHAHIRYLLEAADAAVPVIVLEKPPMIWPGYLENRAADAAMRKAESMDVLHEALEAVEASGSKLLYAENFVYVDGVKALAQLLREVESLEKGKILLQQGVCAHQGSHAPDYDIPEKSGGGALFNKACHPLGSALYLKQVEGLLREGVPIRPVKVSAVVEAVLRRQPPASGEFFRVMRQVDDYARITVVFEDGTLAELTGHDLSISGIHNRFSVIADFGQYDMRLNPNNANELFLPQGDLAGSLLLREKLPTAEGTSYPAPREFHAHGYVNEMEDAVLCALERDRYPQSGTMLAWDTLAVLMAGYESAEKGSRFIDISDYTLGRDFPLNVAPDPLLAGEPLQRH